MNKLVLAVVSLFIVALPFTAQAQQSQDFGEFVVHYNALTTNFIPPEVAKGYGIKRSTSRVLLNVTILKKILNTPGTPVKGTVTASATNLTGQLRDIDIREIADPEGAIYYLGEFSVHNMETLRFVVDVTPNGLDEPLIVKFQQQFYTE